MLKNHDDNPVDYFFMSTANVLLEVDDKKYMFEIYKGFKGVSYSHLVFVMQKLEKLGFVTMENKGTKRIVKLTDNGREVAQYLRNIKDILERKHGMVNKGELDQESSEQQGTNEVNSRDASAPDRATLQ